MSVQHQIDRLIALRAAEWYEKLKDGSDGSNTEFVNWLAESPRHMEAFLVVAGEAPLMREVFESGAFDLDELLRKAKSEVLDLPVAPPLFRTPLQVERKWWRRVELRSIAAVVVVAVLSLGAVLFLFHQRMSWQHFETPSASSGPSNSPKDPSSI